MIRSKRRKQQKRLRSLTRRGLLEALEPRQLLAVTPAVTGAGTPNVTVDFTVTPDGGVGVGWDDIYLRADSTGKLEWNEGWNALGSGRYAVEVQARSHYDDSRQSVAQASFTKGSGVAPKPLLANHPNPFVGSTQIAFSLPAGGDADVILMAGEALSHCLANTVRDIVTQFGARDLVSKIHLLTDASSPVTGFEPYADDFLRDMTAEGMQTTTTTDFIAA